MSTYVLVHGAWHGSWCWVRVAERLRAKGHTVFTPTLTGLAERSHLMGPTISLMTHVRDVVGTIKWEGLNDVILVGHSYGGMVITEAADRAADKLKALVYVDALIPGDGQCSLDLRSEEQNKIFHAKAKAGGGWRIAPTKAADFNVNAADQAWVDGNCTDMSIACFTKRVRLTGAIDRVPNRMYIRAGGFASEHFDTMLTKAKADSRFDCHTLSGGHDLMVDQPDELTDLLLKAG
jgi:pimeloyl-ACP methyl ester carboxylesterase